MLYASLMVAAYNRLPPSATTLASELLDQLLATGGGPPGSVVSKMLRGRRYFYLQRGSGGSRRQTYVGPDTEETRTRLTALQQQEAAARSDAEARARTVAMLRAAGMHVPDGTTARTLEALGPVFRAGAVLVGSLAFAAYEGALGVIWSDGYRTADIDLADVPRLGVGAQEVADIAAALTGVGQPFDPVPGLDPRSPSTSFKLRGKPLLVDVLTPVRDRGAVGPVPLPQLGAHAHPLRYLEYLIAEPMPAAVPVRSGVLVTVPHPARFALHKLLVAASRPAFQQIKAAKDLRQAEQLLAVLAEDRPSDVTDAWRALRRSGARRMKVAELSLARLTREVRERVAELC